MGSHSCGWLLAFSPSSCWLRPSSGSGVPAGGETGAPLTAWRSVPGISVESGDGNGGALCDWSAALKPDVDWSSWTGLFCCVRADLPSPGNVERHFNFFFFFSGRLTKAPLSGSDCWAFQPSGKRSQISTCYQITLSVESPIDHTDSMSNNANSVYRGRCSLEPIRNISIDGTATLILVPSLGFSITSVCPPHRSDSE